MLSIVLTQYLQNFDPGDQLFCLLSEKQGLSPSWSLLYKRQDFRDRQPPGKFCVILLKLRLFWLNCHMRLGLLTDTRRHYSVVNAQILAIKNGIQLLEQVTRAIQQHLDHLLK